MTRWVVDGMNVIGSRPTGWWRDRPRAMRELVEELRRYAESHDEELTVVFDGLPFELPGDERVEVRFATRRGPNAADDDLEELARAGTRVVTSDAGLARRARRAGAEVVGASAFRRLLDGG